jgi:AraC family transcriptional regulator
MRVPGFTVLAGSHAMGSVLPLHSHDDPTLCYVLRGRFSESARGRILDCATDTLKLTAAGEHHSNRFPHTNSAGLRIDINRGRFAESPAILKLLDSQFCHSASGAQLTFRRIVAELATPDDAAPIIVEGLLLEMLARLARERVRETGRAVPKWLLLAEEMIQADFVQPITLTGIAAKVGVDASTLARAYRGRFGLSIGSRVRQMRVEWAAQEMLRSSEPLSRIALLAGFYDQAHFTNVFRRLMGMSPSQFRDSNTSPGSSRSS